MSLDRYYAGDTAWRNYAEAWADDWMKCHFQDELLRTVNHDQLLAQTVYGLFRDEALEWLRGEVPALDDRTPLSCLKSKRGTLAVRECLLRYPYP